MIGSGRDKIESQTDLQRAADTARRLDLDGLVVTGGDDSNTNAAVLAQYFETEGGGFTLHLHVIMQLIFHAVMTTIENPMITHDALSCWMTVSGNRASSTPSKRNS